MDKKEIKDYLKRVDELGAKLVGEDKETYTWLIYGYNQCAKLLNETEQQCQKQKEVFDKAIEYILECSINEKGHINVSLSSKEVGKLLDILNEVLE